MLEGGSAANPPFAFPHSLLSADHEKDAGAAAHTTGLVAVHKVAEQKEAGHMVAGMLPGCTVGVAGGHTVVGVVAGHTKVAMVGPAFAEVASDNTVAVGSHIHTAGDRMAAEMALAARGRTAGAGVDYREHWVEDDLLAQCRAVLG